MKKFHLFILCIVMVFASFSVVSANTVLYTEGSYTLTISSINADWTWTDTFPGKTKGIRLLAIRFNPGAANDRCIINSETVSGADLFDSSVAQNTGEGSIQYYDSSKLYKPVLDVTDGTYNAAAKVTFIFAE